MFEACSMLEWPLAGALDYGAIGERVAERNTEVNDARARFDSRENHFARRGQIGIAAGYVSDEGRLAFEVEGHKSILDDERRLPNGRSRSQITANPWLAREQGRIVVASQ